MKHLQRRTPVEWLCDLFDEIIEAFLPGSAKDWLVLLMFFILLMITAAQQDSLNELYTHVLALMEAAK